MPNSAHLHLILNHFPVIGTGMIVLVLFYGIIINNDKIKKLGLLLLILVSLITIPVFFSGENAEGIIKGMDGVVEANIDPHQDFAKISFIAMEFLGGIYFITLLIFRKEKNIPFWVGIILLMLILIVNAMMIYTGHLGGKISHTELMNVH